jgi:predicted permease
MLQFLQSAAAPVALFALGVTVALRPFDRVPWEVPGMIAVKLVIHPLIAFGPRCICLKLTSVRDRHRPNLSGM